MTPIPPPRSPGPASIRFRAAALLAVKLLVSVGLFAWILRRTELPAVGAAFRSADPRFLLGALALCPLGWLLSVWRWHRLIEAQGGQPRFGFLLRSLLVGIFFNNLLPGTMGGDGVRAYATARLGLGRGRAVAVIFVDRFVGLVSLLVFALLALAAKQRTVAQMPRLAAGMVVGAGLALFATWLLFVRSGSVSALFDRLRRRLPASWQPLFDRGLAAVLAFQGQHRVLAQAFVISLLLQGLVVANAVLLAAALHLALPLASFFLLVPLVLFAMILPVSINGIGLRENVWAFFLAPYGIAASAAVAFSWLEYGLILSQALLGGVVYAFAYRAPAGPAVLGRETAASRGGTP